MSNYINNLYMLIEKLIDKAIYEIKPIQQEIFEITFSTMLEFKYDNTPKLLTYNKIEHNRAWQ